MLEPNKLKLMQSYKRHENKTGINHVGIVNDQLPNNQCKSFPWRLVLSYYANFQVMMIKWCYKIKVFRKVHTDINTRRDSLSSQK